MEQIIIDDHLMRSNIHIVSGDVPVSFFDKKSDILSAFGDEPVDFSDIHITAGYEPAALSSDKFKFWTSSRIRDMYAQHYISSDERLSMYDPCEIEEVKVEYFEERANYLGHLCIIGNYRMITDYCMMFKFDELVDILNKKTYNMYFGTVLHQLLYHNNSDDAFKIYTFLRSNGANPCKNYYDELPWNQRGELWTCIPHDMHSSMHRDVNEFTDLYSKIANIEHKRKKMHP